MGVDRFDGASRSDERGEPTSRRLDINSCARTSSFASYCAKSLCRSTSVAENRSSIVGSSIASADSGSSGAVVVRVVVDRDRDRQGVVVGSLTGCAAVVEEDGEGPVEQVDVLRAAGEGRATRPIHPGAVVEADRAQRFGEGAGATGRYRQPGTTQDPGERDGDVGGIAALGEQSRRRPAHGRCVRGRASGIRAP